MASNIVSRVEKLLDTIEENQKYDPVNKVKDESWMDREMKIIRQSEFETLEQTDKISCSPELQTLIQKSLHLLNPEKISDLVKTQFYNPDIMKTMSCLVMSLLDDEFGYMEMLNQSQVLKLVNKDHMIIFFSHFFQGKNKVLTFKYDQDDIIHEGFIGLLALNKMREVIPTFAWTYGFTSCNLPIFSQKKGKDIIVTACNQKVKQMNKDYIGLITEYVKGDTLTKFIKSPNINDRYLVSSLLTICYSLKYASEMFYYTHWDLHTDNILMRELDTNDNYIYLPNEKKYLWVGNKLATIIDYGFNSAKVDNRLFGHLRPDLGINPLISRSPLNDIFKLFIHMYKNFLAYYFKNKNDPKRKQVLKSFQSIYFELVGAKDTNELQDFNNLLLYQNYAIFPNQRVSSNQNDDITVVKFLTKSFVQLIDGLEKLIPNLIVNQKPKNVLSCVEQNCLSEKQIFDQIFRGLTFETSLKLLIPDILNKKEDLEIIKQILIKYLDEIFQSTQKYENIPTDYNLDTIYSFNELRIAEEKIDKIIKITQNQNLKDIYKRALNQKEIIKKIILSIYDNSIDAISDFKDDFEKDIKAPSDQKDIQRRSLIQIFTKTKDKLESLPKIFKQEEAQEAEQEAEQVAEDKQLEEGEIMEEDIENIPLTKLKRKPEKQLSKSQQQIQKRKTEVVPKKRKSKSIAYTQATPDDVKRFVTTLESLKQKANSGRKSIKSYEEVMKYLVQNSNIMNMNPQFKKGVVNNLKEHIKSADKYAKVSKKYYEKLD